MKGLEVDFSSDETENDNGLIGLEKKVTVLMRCKG